MNLLDRIEQLPNLSKHHSVPNPTAFNCLLETTAAALQVRSANSDPMQLLQRVQIPTVRDTDPLTVVLIHGLHDLHVPSEQSRAFHSACVQRDEEHGFSCMLKFG